MAHKHPEERRTSLDPEKFRKAQNRRGRAKNATRASRPMPEVCEVCGEREI